MRSDKQEASRPSLAWGSESIRYHTQSWSQKVTFWDYSIFQTGFGVRPRQSGIASAAGRICPKTLTQECHGFQGYCDRRTNRRTKGRRGELEWERGQGTPPPPPVSTATFSRCHKSPILLCRAAFSTTSVVGIPIAETKCLKRGDLCSPELMTLRIWHMSGL